MDLGAAVDTLYDVRSKRLALEREVNALKAEESALKDSILKNLQPGTMGIKGTRASFTARKEVEPIVKDWQSVHSWIRDNGEFSLLQKRIANDSWREFKDSGLLIPGTEGREIIKVSVSKVSR